MIPNGPIYSALRTALLDFYPEGIHVKVGSEETCGQWLKTGAFTVKSVTSSSVLIEADAVDFSNVWLSEIENLTNHCFEHLELLISNDLPSKHCSDAWHLVTMYYYGFFAAQTLLRLIGKPQVYLNKEKIDVFVKIASSSIRPNAGVFVVKKVADISATKAEYEFKALKKKTHEALWASVFNYFQEELNKQPASSSLDETALYQILVNNAVKNKYNSLEWPSLIRSEVNYIPGFAYQFLFKRNKTKTKGQIQVWKNCNESDLNKIIRAFQMTCRDYHDYIAFMSLALHVIFVLTRKLYEELFARRNIDKRWEVRRLNFRKSYIKSENDYKLLLKTL